MPVCEPCSTVDHRPTDCENTSKPMCNRTCTCSHGLDAAPAPYRSTSAVTATPTTELDPFAQPRELPAGWVTPAVEESAHALAATAKADWRAIGQRGRVTYQLAAYRNRHAVRGGM